MQKKPQPDKTNSSAGARRTRAQGQQSRNPLDSVKALLQRSAPVLAGLQREALRQRDWLQWVKRELPEDLAGHVTGVTEQSGELVIFAESAAWGVRLRYVAPQLLSSLNSTPANITGVRVRVVPRGVARGI